MSETVGPPPGAPPDDPSPPSASAPKLFYNKDCVGPFVVNISKKDNFNPMQNIHPLQVSRFLKDAKVQGVDHVGKLGRNIVQISFLSWMDANCFLANSHQSNPKFQCSIPKYKLLKKGIIKDIPVDFSESELMEMIQSPYTVHEIKRMYKYDRVKKERFPIPMVIVTFVSNFLPEFVKFDYFKTEVNLYIRPVALCYNCFKYGHFRTFCRGKKVCFKCGNLAHENDCPPPPPCLNCSADHLPSDPLCTARKTQKKINGIMAEKNISYNEAKELSGSYGDNYVFGKKSSFSRTLRSNIPSSIPTKNQFSVLQMDQFPSFLRKPVDTPKNSRKTKTPSSPRNPPSHSLPKRKSCAPHKKSVEDDDFPTDFVLRLKVQDKLNEQINAVSTNNVFTFEADNNSSSLPHVSASQEVALEPVLSSPNLLRVPQLHQLPSDMQLSQDNIDNLDLNPHVTTNIPNIPQLHQLPSDMELSQDIIDNSDLNPHFTTNIPNDVHVPGNGSDTSHYSV